MPSRSGRRSESGAAAISERVAMPQGTGSPHGWTFMAGQSYARHEVGHIRLGQAMLCSPFHQPGGVVGVVTEAVEVSALLSFGAHLFGPVLVVGRGFDDGILSRAPINNDYLACAVRLHLRTPFSSEEPSRDCAFAFTWDAAARCTCYDSTVREAVSTISAIHPTILAVSIAEPNKKPPVSPLPYRCRRYPRRGVFRRGRSRGGVLRGIIFGEAVRESAQLLADGMPGGTARQGDAISPCLRRCHTLYSVREPSRVFGRVSRAFVIRTTRRTARFVRPGAPPPRPRGHG